MHQFTSILLKTILILAENIKFLEEVHQSAVREFSNILARVPIEEIGL